MQRLVVRETMSNVLSTSFKHLNTGWNAEPNVPLPRVASDGRILYLQFVQQHCSFFTFKWSKKLTLGFDGCSRFRFTTMNDHGWYNGDCRFSTLAPAWGEFYEVSGDFLEGQENTPWEIGPCALVGPKNFIFYFRDESFECSAASWAFVKRPPSHLNYREPNHDV